MPKRRRYFNAGSDQTASDEVVLPGSSLFAILSNILLISALKPIFNGKQEGKRVLEK